MHAPLIAAGILGLAATTISTGPAGAQSAPTTCLLHVHPWDDMSRRLEVVTPTGTQVLLSVQDNRTTLGGERTFELNADVTRVHWTWNRAAGDWRVDLGVAPGCAMDPYPYWTDGSHPASLSMTVGQVPTTTTQAPTTTTTAPVPTTTTPPVTRTTGPTPTTSTTVATPGATTTAPAPLTAQRVTPAPTTEVVTTAPQLPATGRRTWPQVRLALGLMAVGVAAIAMSVIMRQDDELDQGDR